jgi:hypothetical protein
MLGRGFYSNLYWNRASKKLNNCIERFKDVFTEKSNSKTINNGKKRIILARKDIFDGYPLEDYPEVDTVEFPKELFIEDAVCGKQYGERG